MYLHRGTSSRKTVLTQLSFRRKSSNTATVMIESLIQNNNHHPHPSLFGSSRFNNGPGPKRPSVDDDDTYMMAISPENPPSSPIIMAVVNELGESRLTEESTLFAPKLRKTSDV